MKQIIFFLFFILYTFSLNADHKKNFTKKDLNNQLDKIESYKDKFFGDRELDDIEGIWVSREDRDGVKDVVVAVYAIMKSKSDIGYDTFTIYHNIYKYIDHFERKSYYKIRKLPSGKILYSCTTTIYDPRDPSIESVGNGSCRLDTKEHVIMESWQADCWTGSLKKNGFPKKGSNCWMNFSSKLVMDWPNNYDNKIKFKKYAIYSIGILILVLLLIYVNKKSKNLALVNYNKQFKTKLKTSLELKEYKQRIEDREYLKKEKYQKEIDAKEAKQEREAKAEETRIRAEERRLEKEEKKKEKLEYSDSDETYDDSLVEKVKRLKRLYKNGTLSKAEFEKAKNKLLK